jgi:hypothetical protein
MQSIENQLIFFVLDEENLASQKYKIGKGRGTLISSSDNCGYSFLSNRIYEW